MEENSEGQPVGHAGADEWEDDAIPSRGPAPCLGCPPQRIHADAYNERSQLCSNHLTHQLCPDDAKVCRHTSLPRPDHWETRICAPSSNSQPHTYPELHCILRAVALSSVEHTEPVCLPKSNGLLQPSPSDKHFVFPHFHCQLEQFACDKPHALVNDLLRTRINSDYSNFGT